MIHPAISREGAEVWVVCPQCANEGSADSQCPVCDDVGTLPMAEAVKAVDAGRTHEMFFRRGLEAITT